MPNGTKQADENAAEKKDETPETPETPEKKPKKKTGGESAGFSFLEWLGSPFDAPNAPKPKADE